MKKTLMTFAAGVISLFTMGQTIVTEAPSVSASAVTVPQAHLQAEATFGYLIGNVFENQFSSNSWNLPSFLLRYGITDRFEARATITPNLIKYLSPFPGEQFNIDNIGLGFKYQLTSEEATSDMALISHLKINSYNDIQHTDETAGWTGDRSYGLIYAASHDFGNGRSLGGNIGYQLDDYNNQFYGYYRIHNFNASVVQSFSIGDRLTVFGELFTSFSKLHYKHGSNIQKLDWRGTFGIDAGVQFLLTNNIQIDYDILYNFGHESMFQSLGFNILIPSR